MSDVGFAYSARWWQLGEIAPENTVTLLEDRDRELEQHLDAPARTMAGRLFVAAAPFTDVTADVDDFRVRWEWQRGQWVSFEAQGRGSTRFLGTSAGIGAFTTSAILLPPEAPPVAPTIGRPAVLGSAAVNLTAGLVAPAFLNNVWCIPLNVNSTWGGSTANWFSVHVMYLAQQ
jgi:hypothetical protein